MPTIIDEISRRIPITPEITEALLQIITEQTFKRGDTISAIGEMRSYLYFMTSGLARVYYLKSGKEHTYSFAFNGEAISLSKPLLSNNDYSATIEFLETSSVSILKFEALEQLIKQFDPSIAKTLIGFFLNGLRVHTANLEERIIMLQTCSAPERFNWLINKHPKVLERANITQIASYLGVTKETLYRIRSGKYKATSDKTE